MGVFIVGGIGRTTCEHSVSCLLCLRASSRVVYHFIGLGITRYLIKLGYFYIRVRCLVSFAV